MEEGWCLDMSGSPVDPPRHGLARSKEKLCLKNLKEILLVSFRRRGEGIQCAPSFCHQLETLAESHSCSWIVPIVIRLWPHARVRRTDNSFIMVHWPPATTMFEQPGAEILMRNWSTEYSEIFIILWNSRFYWARGQTGGANPVALTSDWHSVV